MNSQDAKTPRLEQRAKCIYCGSGNISFRYTTKGMAAECHQCCKWSSAFEESKPGTSPIPLFEDYAKTTIERATSTFGQRGSEYGDTWRECRFLTMKAVAKKLGIEIKPEHFRALATAAFCDMKYERMGGGYKDDSLIDGINYSAFLAEEMRCLE